MNTKDTNFGLFGLCEPNMISAKTKRAEYTVIDFSMKLLSKIVSDCCIRN